MGDFTVVVFILHSTFRGNTGRKAASLDIIYYPVVMLGHNDFSNNTGPSLRVSALLSVHTHIEGSTQTLILYFRIISQIVGANMLLNGTLDFIGNNAENLDGGALYIISRSQVVMQRGSQMNFIENRGSLGSSIVVETQHIQTGLLRTVNNPLCFLRYSDDSLPGIIPPSEWREVRSNATSSNSLADLIQEERSSLILHNSQTKFQFLS